MRASRTGAIRAPADVSYRRPKRPGRGQRTDSAKFEPDLQEAVVHMPEVQKISARLRQIGCLGKVESKMANFKAPPHDRKRQGATA